MRAADRKPIMGAGTRSAARASSSPEAPGRPSPQRPGVALHHIRYLLTAFALFWFVYFAAGGQW